MFFSGKDSLSQSFSKGFNDNGWETKYVNYTEFNSDFQNTLFETSNLFPSKYRLKVEQKYRTAIQKKYLEIVKTEKPDLVFIYNDQMVEAPTIKEIKKKSKVAVYLADSPFFLQRREHILPMLFEVDHVYAPDTFWIEQLKLIGIKNLSFLIGGYHVEKENEIVISEEEKKKFSADLFFIGSTYKDSWGYKRALFLSKFTNHDIKIYGPPDWKYWFKYFPGLQDKMILGQRVDFITLQKMMKCCKFYPIDSNPGLINGLHIRIFDSIASGLMPIIENKKDIALAFPGFDIPIIDDYEKIPTVIQKNLENDHLRINKVDQLQSYLKEKYAPKIVVSILLKKLY